MKYAFFIPALAVMTLSAFPALSQVEAGNPGPSVHASAIQQNQVPAYNPRHGVERLSPDQRHDALQRGDEMLRDVKQQIKEAKTEDDRLALRERKREIENAMIQAQQAN